jgi:iron-sulfur cluster repair protein YtfE (RIC family)
LHRHHAGEDLGLFRALADRRPDLTPILDRLRVEHERIAVLVEELRRVVGERHADPTRVLPEVVRLTEELEAHLAYEEERLIPVLEAATAP